MAQTDAAANNPLAEANALVQPVPQVTPETVAPVAAPSTAGVVSASQVYSPANVASAVTAPVARPDYSDPFKLYSSFMESPEILATRNEISGIQNEILGLNQTLRSSLQGFKDSPISMNAIRGAQVAATDKAALPLEALSENLNAKTAFYNTQITDASNKLSIAREERAQLQSLISQTGGKAGITWNDSFETATKKAQKYIDKVNEDAEKKAKKEKLGEMLFSLTGTVAKNGMSTKDLEKAVSKAGASQKAIESEMQQIQLQKARLDLRNAGSGGATGKAGTIVSNAQTALLASKGTDGKVDPGVYASWRAKYAEATGSTANFDAQFANLLSKNEQSGLGITSGSGQGGELATAVMQNPALFNTLTPSARTEITPILAASGFKFPRELSGEQAKAATTANDGLQGIGFLENQIYDSNGGINRSALVAAKTGLGQTAAAQRTIVDAISRIRTGAALTNNEESFYKQQIPNVMDDQATINQKSNQLKALFAGVSGSALTLKSPEGKVYEFSDMFEAKAREEVRKAITEGFQIIQY